MPGKMTIDEQLSYLRKGTTEIIRETDLRAKLAPELFELLFVEAMPVQDAVDLARFLVEATASRHQPMPQTLLPRL